MQCRDCNENLEGDGYTQVLWCPNLNENTTGWEDMQYAAPDEGPFYCNLEEETDEI